MTFEEKLLAARDKGATRDDVLGSVPRTSTAEHLAAIDRVFPEAPAEAPAQAEEPSAPEAPAASDDLLSRLGFEPPAPVPAEAGQPYNPEFHPEQTPPEELGVSELWSKSRDLDSTLQAMERWTDERAFRVDPNYKLDNLEQLEKDIPPAYRKLFQEQIMEAKSADHAVAIQARFLHEVAESQQIAQAGWKGLGVRLAANLFDEGGLALAAAGPAGWLVKGGRMVRIAKMAVAAGVENAILEQVVKSGSQTRTSEDVMYALLGGLVLGGGIGAVMPARKAAPNTSTNRSGNQQTQPQANPQAAAGSSAAPIHGPPEPLHTPGDFGPEPLHGPELPDVPAKAAEAIHELDKASVRAMKDNSPQPLSGTLKAHTEANAEDVLESVGYQPRPEPVTQPATVKSLVFDKNKELDVEATAGQLPPVADGYTRLYRAESPTVKFEDVFDTQKLYEFSPGDRPGQFYTDQLSYADYFRQTYGKDASIKYIDVRKDLLEESRVKDGYVIDTSKHKVVDEVAAKRAEYQAAEKAAKKAAKKEAARLAREAEQAAAKRVKQEARVVELEAEMKKLRSTVVDAPVKPKLGDEFAKVKQALADLKAAAKATDAKVRINADRAVQQAKRHFMRILQTEHPDDFKKSGLSANPKTADFEAWAKSKGAKAVARAEKQFAKDTDEYNKTLDTLDEQLVRMKDEHAALKNELAAPPEKPVEKPVEPEAPQAAGNSVGAAKAAVQEPELTRMEDRVLFQMMDETTDTAMADARGGLFATLNKSKNAIVRWLGEVTMSDHVGAKDKGWVSKPSATTIAQVFEQKVLAKYTSATRAAYLQWAKAQGLHLYTVKGVMKRGFGLRSEFNRKVFAAVEQGSQDPHIHKAVQAWRELSRATFERMKEAGVVGWEKIPFSDDYVPHIHNTSMWRRMAYELEGETAPLQKLVKGSLRAANPKLTDEVAEKVARKYVDSVRRHEAGIDGRYGDLNRGLDPIYARQLLEEIDLEEQEIEYVIKMLTRADEAVQSGGLSRQKHRALLDLDYTIRVKSKETYQEFDLSMRDMFEQDIDKLAHSYVRALNGWASLSEATRGRAYHINSPAAWDALINEGARLEASMAPRKGVRAKVTQVLAGKVSDSDKATYDAEVELLTMLKNSLTGVPVNDPTSAWTKWARRIKEYNFVTMMGQVIWNQSAEIGSAISHLGWIRTMKAIPQAMQAIKRSKVTGELDHELARMAETEWGMGSTALRGREHPMWVSDLEAMSDSYSKLDAAMHHLKNVVAAPMHLMMTFQQRMLSIGMLHKFGDWAMGRIEFSPAEMTRMRHLGLSEADLTKIREQYAKHATWSNMKTHSGKLLNVNPEKWDDYEAWTKLKYALHRISTRVVQENDFSNVPPILSKNTASLAVQFRSFIIGAHEKHLLHNLHYRDMEAFTNTVYTSLFAGLAYVGMTHTKAIGMDEKRKRKYLKERLADEEIAKASFSRASWSGLMPTVIDTALARGGFDPLFSHTRGSGLSTSFVSGIPAVASGDRLLSASRGLVAPLVNPNYELSDTDWNALSGAMPMGNLIGVYNVLNAAGDSLDLPRFSKDR